MHPTSLHLLTLHKIPYFCSKIIHSCIRQIMTTFTRILPPKESSPSKGIYKGSTHTQAADEMVQILQFFYYKPIICLGGLSTAKQQDTQFVIIGPLPPPYKSLPLVCIEMNQILLSLEAPIPTYKFSKLISTHFLTELVERIW